jgi:hypothetical protein
MIHALHARVWSRARERNGAEEFCADILTPPPGMLYAAVPPIARGLHEGVSKGVLNDVKRQNRENQQNNIRRQFMCCRQDPLGGGEGASLVQVRLGLGLGNSWCEVVVDANRSY